MMTMEIIVTVHLILSMHTAHAVIFICILWKHADTAAANTHTHTFIKTCIHTFISFHQSPVRYTKRLP